MGHVILNMHGIGTPERAMEQGEAPYWISSEQFEMAVRMAETAMRGGTKVSFTFDDGNLSDLHIGAEVLNKAGLTATFFVLAGRIGEAGSLDVPDIRTLMDMGHRIGSHGWAHRDWTALTDTEIPQEFDAARNRLSEIYGQPVVEAAIPFGRYNRRVLQHIRKAGFTQAYSSDGGMVGAGDWPLPRTSLTGDMGEADVARILKGGDPLARRVRRQITKRLKRVL